MIIQLEFYSSECRDVEMCGMDPQPPEHRNGEAPIGSGRKFGSEVVSIPGIVEIGLKIIGSNTHMQAGTERRFFCS